MVGTTVFDAAEQLKNRKEKIKQALANASTPPAAKPAPAPTTSNSGGKAAAAEDKRARDALNKMDHTAIEKLRARLIAEREAAAAKKKKKITPITN